MSVVEADRVYPDAVVYRIERAPEHEIGDCGFDQQALGRMPTFGGDFIGDDFGAMVLNEAEE